MSVAACIAAGAFTAPLFAQDECTSATVLQLDVPTPFSTLTATASAGVPVDTNCAASALLWTATTPDIWFKWTAPANGLATFNACSSDLNAIDTSLVLYKGLCGSMVQIACNGDAPHNSNATCNPTDAKISSVMVTEGSVYYLRVGGIDSEFGVARGSGQIQVSLSRIAAWGDNTFNQCTIPSTIGIPSKVSGGSNHVFAIRADGTLVGWGSNLLGQLNVPATVTTVRDVSAGQTFTVAVRTNGTLAGWGSNTSNRATPPATVTDAISIAAGGFHGLALRATGTVVAWGAGLTNTGLANNYGQSIVPAGLSNVTGISAGFYHSVAVRSDGFVNAWGAGAAPTPTTNNFGQSIVPAGLAGVTKVACGWHHTLALRADGTVAAWGAGTVNNNANPNWGQSIVPADLAGVIDVAGGQYFSLALRSNGTVAAWGRNVDREREVPTWTGPLAALTTVGASALAIYDGCPEDPLSTADCVDNCPDDPNKREPGICGCGVPDVDTDGDTVLDCLDACPSDPTLTAKLIYFADADGDGFGDAATQVLSCQHTPPAGSVANSSDCNDALLTYADSDNDGFGAGVPVACGLATNTDCNDAVAAINPGATELCDALNVDENCNGLADNLDAGALETSKSNFFADLDNDNWSLATPSRFCDSPSPSYRSTPSSPADCNDADAAINPGAAERCDAGDVDENCNGTADNSDPSALESTKTSFYGDLDNDLFTVANASRFCDRPSGYFQTASALADCNDADATVYPNAVENCANRGVDNDCDGTANSDAEAIDATTYYADNDNDTYGAGAVVKSCVSLAGHVLNNLDCNDSDATAFPGGTETCANHGVDNNCNGVANDPTESPDARTYYTDIDGDGFGNAAAPIPSCANTPAAGQANNSTDCDDTRFLYPDADQDGYGSSTRVACGIAVTGDCNDTNAAVNPGATESCNQIDDNCNGVVDDSVVFNNYYRDTDADGFGDANGTPVSSCSPVVRHVTNNLDCDDTRFLYADADGDGRGAGAPAPCGVPTNDDGCPNNAQLFAPATYYRDADNDGFGAAAVSVSTCNQGIPTGYVTNSADCNDAARLYADNDNDTFGAGAPVACGVTSNTDCNDAVATINPAAPELCDPNNVDENCNDFADNLDPTTLSSSKSNFYADIDNDAFTLGVASRFCDQPTGYRTTATIQVDCNDNNAAINPGANEVCDANNTDENCNGIADNNDPTATFASRTNFWADNDNDTYTLANAARFCDQPTGYRTAASAQADCNDANAAINPGATEVCDANNLDENCNNLADNNDAGASNASKTNFWADLDGDTYTPATAARFCDRPIGYLTAASAQADCNDNSAAINPGATEICDANNTDENCNSLADNADPGAADAGRTTYYVDADNDTYTLSTSARLCDAQAGYRLTLSNPVDCNDASAAVNPGATEVCDASNVDENCNNLADDADATVSAASKSNFYADLDADNFTLANAVRFCDEPVRHRAAPSALIDCNDNNAAINPGASEICDPTNTDEDCDSLADDADFSALPATKSNFYADIDNDTYTLATVSRFCDQPAGYRTAASALADCNDAVAAINPGATEVCDAGNIDENCNNLADNNDSGVLDSTRSNFWADSDNDTYTVIAASRFCDQPAGYRVAASPQADCNDAVASINPGASEICDANNVDENCNNLADNNDPGALLASKSDFWPDLDSDTYTADVVGRFCDQPALHRALRSPLIDCNDAVAAINPGATEICDAGDTDEDCDTLADNADSSAADAGKTDFWADLDNDTFTAAAGARFCDQPAGFVTAASALADCNDAIAAINPAATEVCDAANTDENCSGAADDADAGVLESTKTNFWADLDSDTYTVDVASRFCDQPALYRTAVSNDVDCDDARADVHPESDELCDAANTDENCNGVADDGDLLALDATKTDFWADADGDTYTVTNAARFCDQPAGFVLAASALVDCNDAVAAINPGMTELCDSANVDENCTGAADDADTGALESTKTDFWADLDTDAYTVAEASRFCDQPAGFLAAASTLVDCNDTVATINPGMTELCDASNVDENCNNLADDADAGALESTKTDFWLDADGDTYTVATVSRFCDQPALYLAAVSAEIDCNDGVAAINPGMTELCDASDIDENCNNLADDADAGALESTKTDFWLDADSDTYTVAEVSRFCDQPALYLAAVSAEIDCNDGVAAINPGKTELCDASDVDENCNNLADDADAGALESTKTDFWADLDADSYTVAAASRFCDQPVGFVTAASTLVDCNDGVATINPGMTELCDASNIDEDCNNLADDADAGALESTKTDFWLDADGDTYTIAAASRFCDQPALYLAAVSAEIDCNDGVAAINPGMVELCDASNVDEDCNNLADDADAGALESTKTDFWLDADSDTYTVAEVSRFCDQPALYLAAVSAEIDCNDGVAAINPGMTELCDASNVDENCTGAADDADTGALESTKTDFWADLDGDSFTVAAGSRFCDQPAGFVTAASTLVDCNDAVATINPGMTELCDASNVDEDCNNLADDADAGALESTKTDFWADLDDDAYTVAAISRFCDQPALYRAAVSAEIDCNDAVAVINPGMPEICDSADTDENCNGLADNADIAALEATKTGYFADFDNDTYTVAAAASFCDRPTLYRDAASHLIDCNDGDAAINPGMPEICDALDTDEDCNLRADNADLFALDATKTDFWADLDADGFTVSGATRFCDIVAGYMVAATAGVDCDDAAALTYPGAVELCATTTVDNNCDGTIDDVDVGAADKVDYWRDADLDSFTIAETARFCPGTTNSGYLPAPSLLVDCDDAANMTYPGAEENCGNLGIDNDCNGVNAESESVDLVTFYADSDADGAGDPDVTAQRCVVPAGYVAVAGDECPANGQLVVKASYYLDSDADGEGDPAFPILSCDSTPPTGYSASSGDGCPADPAKVAPGTCGCGVADVDSDGDLVLDCVDNCPSVSNADQLNCDTDAFGNACDSDDDNDAIADHNDAYACDAAKSDLDAGYTVAEMTAFLTGATSVTVDATGMDIAQLRVVVALADRVASGGLGGTFTLDSRFTVAELAVLLGKAAPPTGFVGAANITIDALGMSAEQLDEVIAQIGRVTTIVELSLDASFTAAEIATLVSRTAAGEATILVTDMTREQLLASVSGPNAVFVRGHLEIDASFTAEQIARIVGSALAGQTTFDVDTSGMSAAQQGALLSTASLIIDADAAVAAGGTFTVYVDVSGLPIRAVGIQASVSFDPTKLEFVSTEPIGGIDFPWAIYLQQNADNVRFSTGIDLGGSLTGILEGNVARLTFRAIEPLCGATSLVWLTPTGFDNTITSAATATENSAPIPFTAINRARVVDLNSVAFANVPAANFSVPTDAGSVFGAHIADPQVSASNNCGAIPVDMVVQYPAGSGLPTGSSWPSAFPIGTTSVTWSMVDPLGAVHSVSRTVEVRDHQVIVLDVHLDGVIANQLFTLPIRLQLDGEQPIITAVTFQGGIGQVREVNVPVRTGYTCMTAKDALHTLAAALPVQISGARYVTNGAFHLVGGDSNDDNIVDVIDFGGLVADYGAGKDANSRSNFNRDGFVTNADLAFIAIHFLRRGESCSAGFDGDAPRSRITVKELRRMGLGEFEIADLNGDGWIDATDIALAAQGVMPRGTAPRASEPRDANATRW